MNLGKQKAAQAQKDQRFSQARAIQLCAEVEAMEAEPSLDPARLREALRDLSEVLVYNDKHNEAVVDKVLMERELMKTLERLVTNAMFPAEVKEHVLQCVTVLLQNLTRVSSIYFLCSNNRINRMIAIDIDEEDDALVSMYASFLKSLALRLNKDTVQFFFEAGMGAFPLFDKAAKMMSSTKDAMVRAATRQIVVCVVQVEDAAVKQFVHESLPEVYDGVLQSITAQLVSLSAMTPRFGAGGALFHAPASTRLDARGILALMEDVTDDILYINDLHSADLASTDMARLTAATSERVLAPIARLLAAGLSTAGEQPHPAIEPALATNVSPPVALAFMGRWARENQIEPLQSAFYSLFLGCGTTRTAGAPSLLGRILADAPLLAPSALRLRHTLLSRATGGESPTGDVVKAAVPAAPPTADPAATPLSCDGYVTAVCAEGSCRPDDLALDLPCLAAALYHSLTDRLEATSLCAVVTLIRQIARGLLPAGLSLFRSLSRRLCRQSLREVFHATFAANLAYLDAAVQSAAASAETDAWLDRRPYIEALGLADPFVCMFLDARRAWRAFSQGEYLAEMLAARDKTDVSSLLYVMPSLRFVHGSASWSDQARDEYRMARQQVRETVPLHSCPPMGSREREQHPFLVWFTVEEDLHQLAGTAEFSLGEAMCRTLCLVRETDVFPVERAPVAGDAASTSTVPLWCQVVMTRFDASKAQFLTVDAMSPGACVYLVVTDKTALFLGAAKRSLAMVPSTDASTVENHEVLLALDIAYLRAALMLPEPAAYRAVIQGLHPGRETELHVVFKDSDDAAVAVRLLNQRARDARRSSGALCRALIIAAEDQ